MSKGKMSRERGLHPISKGWTLVRIVERPVYCSTKVCERSCWIGWAMLRGQCLIVTWISLQHISINGLRLQTMHLCINVRLSKRSLAVHGIQAARRAIHFRQRICSQRLMHVATSICTNCLAVECHMAKRLLRGEAAEVVHLFTL